MPSDADDRMSESDNQKPVMCWTHPRACSTALERAFMTVKTLRCVHEPFGDCFYFGPEKMAQRLAQMDCSGQDIGNSTYKKALQLLLDGNEKCRVFAKDTGQYLIPPHSMGEIAPSFGNAPREPENPTVIPQAELSKFKHIFLIRSPIKSIPSYFRCTVPPLSLRTGFHSFREDEAGYRELLMLIDFLKSSGIEPSPCVLDAQDLLYDPEKSIEGLCIATGIPYSGNMLSWNPNDGCNQFEKWDGFHDDAKVSSGFKKKVQGSKLKAAYDLEEEYETWKAIYTPSQAQQIYDCVLGNLPLYQKLRAMVTIKTF